MTLTVALVQKIRHNLKEFNLAEKL